MNTPTIAAALSSPPVQTGRAAGNSSDAESGASFSHVLGDQHAAIEQQARTAAQAYPTAGSKTAQSAKPKTDAESPPSDAALAELAGEQGLSLPQIALSLAAHVLAGTTQGSTDLPEDSSLAMQVPAQTQALPRGKADLATLLAKATPTRDGGEPTKASAQTPSTDSATPGRFSVASTDEPLLALNNSTPVGTTTSNARVAATQLRAGGAGQPANKLTDAAAQVPGSLQSALAAASTPSSTTTLPDNTTAISHSATPINDIASLASIGAQAQNANTAIFTSTSLGVAAPLQSPQWPSDFSRQFVMLSQNAGNQPQTAELRLDPPELGPIRITINISDNVAHAAFVSAHASVRNAIENALPQLQQQLAQAGISLGQANVSDQGQQQPAFEQSSQSAGKHAGRATSGALTTGLESAVAQASARAIQNPNSLVDTFV